MKFHKAEPHFQGLALAKLNFYTTQRPKYAMPIIKAKDSKEKYYAQTTRLFSLGSPGSELVNTNSMHKFQHELEQDRLVKILKY